MQKLGQYFLKNAAILKTIVAAVAVVDGDHIIEIGPGHGELTMPIARAARGKKCEIICIEKDRIFIQNLELLAIKEGRNQHTHITITEGDALKLLPEIVATLPREEQYKIVGNIPYYITGKLLRTISALEYKPRHTVLLIQKEVAERIHAMPPEMNRLAASVQFWADAKIIAQVPRNDFSPPPDVDSAVVILKTKIKPSPRPAGAHPPMDDALYYRAVRTIFAQPRKTLLNNLLSTTKGSAGKDALAAQLKKIGVDPGARPQDLSVEQIITIAQAPLWG